MNGSAGCNKYQATFGEDLGMQTTLNSNEICALPIGVMEQERVYLQALSRAYGYWLTDDQLIINTGGGALTYRMTPPSQSSDQAHLMQQHTWFLVSYNTSLSAPGEQGDPNLRFSLDGSLSGYTGCNALSGRYTTDLNKITIGDLSQTQEPCTHTILSAQEKAIMDVLRTAQTYQVIDTSMQLVGSAGVLNFYFAPVNRPEDVVAPDAVISAPSQAKVGEVVIFDASQSTAQVPITGYSWDFGDGSKARGEVIKHVYEKPGTYWVQMTVIDARGFSNTDTMNIEILPLVEPTEPPTPEPTQPPVGTPEPTQPPAQVPPQAAIQGSERGFPGEPVTFSGLASQPGSSPIANYQWDLYDLMDEPLVPGTAITLQFLEGEVLGFAGCNTYSGNYTAEENEDGTYDVTIEALQITQIGCPETIMKQEALYLGLLTSVQVAQIQGNELRLGYPEGIDPDGQPYPAGELLLVGGSHHASVIDQTV